MVGMLQSSQTYLGVNLANALPQVTTAGCRALPDSGRGLVA